MNSNNKSRYKTAEVLYIENELKIIRKREVFEDLIKNQVEINL